MFYRRDIEDKKRPKPMRTFELDPIEGMEASETSKQSNTIWFVGVVLLMLVVVVAVAFILRMYFSREVDVEGRNLANWAEPIDPFETQESTASESVPDAYELLDELKSLLRKLRKK